MIATSVTVFVKREHVEDFIKATILNHEGTRKEPGNMRFDFLQSVNDPTRFMLYEVFDSEEAISSHKETPHYLTWKKTVAVWMEKPREGVPHRIIRPEDKSEW